jgi:hypothetical protein
LISPRTKIKTSLAAAWILIIAGIRSRNLIRETDEDVQWVKYSHTVITQVQDAEMELDRIDHEIRVLVAGRAEAAALRWSPQSGAWPKA